MRTILDTAEWRRIRVSRVQRMFGSTEQVECADGTMLTINTGMTAGGSAADARGLLHELEEARVLVDGTRIVGVGRTNPSVHPVTLSIMKALEMDVDAILAWALSPEVWVEEVHNRMDCPENAALFDNEDRLMLMVGYNGDYTILHQTICVHAAMPEAIVSASIGRLLRQVVSIPDLDGLDLEIVSSDQSTSGCDFKVVPDDGWTALANEPAMRSQGDPT